MLPARGTGATILCVRERCGRGFDPGDHSRQGRLRHGGTSRARLRPTRPGGTTRGDMYSCLARPRFAASPDSDPRGQTPLRRVGLLRERGVVDADSDPRGRTPLRRVHADRRERVADLFRPSRSDPIAARSG